MAKDESALNRCYEFTLLSEKINADNLLPSYINEEQITPVEDRVFDIYIDIGGEA